MKWEMEVLSPASYLSTTNWLTEESEATKWTAAENKMFENALAVYDKDSPDRWHKVAAMIPGKTVGDVIKQYRELEADVNSIEAGLIPLPGYINSPFTLDWANSNHTYDSCKQSYVYNGKRCSSNQERKKGVPWTEEEHKLFLMGLKKHGKGDWRNIARNFVVTRTPTQVASHAQKYFIRQHSGGKDKRRASIHDITTVNLDEITIPSPDSDERSFLPDQNRVLSQQSNPISTHYNWNQIDEIGFDSGNGSMLMSLPFGFSPNGYEFGTGPQSIGFQMRPGQHFP